MIQYDVTFTDKSEKIFNFTKSHKNIKFKANNKIITL